MKLLNTIISNTSIVSMLVVCVPAAAHESLYQAVEQGDVYAGRPFVDPETGYLFVDPDGMRNLRWQSADMTAVRVADNDYTGVPIVTWKGLGRVESRENAQVLVGALFMFDYDDQKLNETNVKGSVEVLVDSNDTDSVGLRYDHISKAPVDVITEVDPNKGRWQWISLPFDHARFGNRVYGRADFSIFPKGSYGYTAEKGYKPEMVIADVRVKIDKTYPAFVGGPGALHLTVEDSETGDPVGARFGLYELKTGWSPKPDESALPLWVMSQQRRQINLRSAYDEGKAWPGKGAWISWTDGNYSAQIPSGRYQLVLYKGPEYHVVDKTITIEPGKTNAITVDMKRWRDLSSEGWYSGDLHLHVDRFEKVDNRLLSQILEAEDINVGVDLQLMYDLVFIMHQLYGEEGRHQEGNYMVVPGQETPRGSQWGHFNAIDVSRFFPPKNYLAPHEIMPTFREDGAVVGMNHVMLDLFGASNGLAMNMPIDGFDYLEVLQQSVLGTEQLYNWLDLGYKVTPSAGTDFPVMGHVGQERTFVNIDGTFSREKWKEALLAGRVFVSNAPVIELSVNGKGMGDEVRVKPGERIRIIASAAINPDFDELERLELVAHGKVIESVSSSGGKNELALDVELETDHGLWLAVRAYGKKSAKAHSGIVYVLTEGRDGFWNYERAKELVAGYQKRLISAMENANMNDPRIWATGGRLQQVWEEALPSNNARAKAAKEALDVRLAEIDRNRPERMNQPVVH
ncbi:MAG: CehA/McbA family metallohydrolase [Deltaproteobacteria bacterium]|nr:CehA/McbA family metallohydrolase [Deltaproteobacteria bacterium]